MEKDGKWIMRWRYAIAPKPVETGSLAQEGGRLSGSRSGRRPSNGKAARDLENSRRGDASGAYRFLQAEIEQVRSGEVSGEEARIRFSEYAASLFERKVTKGKIRSAKTREKWEHDVAPPSASRVR